MLKQSFLTGIALGSVILAPVVLKNSVLAQTPNAATKIDSNHIFATVNSPIYIAQANTSLASVEQAIYNQVNQYRKQRGLSALSLDERISEKARIHSQNMASGAVPFSHNGFAQRIQEIAKVIPYRSAAENVAYNQGYANPATQAVQGWLNSSGHRQNIEGSYNLTGIGVARNDKGEYYFTQIFIRSR